MKKVFGLIVVLTLTAGTLFAVAPGNQPKIPPCGGCEEGTWDAANMICSGVAADCMSCTVCD